MDGRAQPRAAHAGARRCCVPRRGAFGTVPDWPAGRPSGADTQRRARVALPMPMTEQASIQDWRRSHWALAAVRAETGQGGLQAGRPRPALSGSPDNPRPSRTVDGHVIGCMPICQLWPALKVLQNLALPYGMGRSNRSAIRARQPRPKNSRARAVCRAEVSHSIKPFPGHETFAVCEGLPIPIMRQGTPGCTVFVSTCRPGLPGFAGKRAYHSAAASIG